MPSGSGFQVSRRQILKIGAGTVFVGALGIEVAQKIAAAIPSPAASTDPRAAMSGRVIEVEGDRVQVQVFGSTTRLTAPVVGFPDTVFPRVGDHVTLTNLVDGFATAALPLCHWVAGVPKVGADQTVAIGGTRIAPSATVLQASQSGKAISVCVLDTSLTDCQALSVKG
jgi:hypothetical protein